MRGYNGMANCTVKELFGTFRVVLYNSQKSIFQETIATGLKKLPVELKSRTIKPKVGNTRDNRKMLLEAFIKEARFNKKQVSALTHLYNVYLELKEQREKRIAENPYYFLEYSQGEFTASFTNSIINDSSSPLTFKKSQSFDNFKVFTSSKRQLPNLGEILKGILDEENIHKNLHHLTRNASINASVKNELHTRKQLTSDDKNLSVSNNKKNDCIDYYSKMDVKSK